MLLKTPSKRYDPHQFEEKLTNLNRYLVKSLLLRALIITPYVMTLGRFKSTSEKEKK